MKRFAMLVSAVFLLSGCASSWQTVEAPPGQFEWEAPEQVRVTMEQGDQYQLRDVRVERDSMIGVGHPVGEATVTPARTALALGAIERVERPVDRSVTATDVLLMFGGAMFGACVSDMTMDDPVFGICN